VVCPFKFLYSWADILDTAMKAWEIADVAKLRPHERTDPERVKEIQKDLLHTNLIQKAITVDRQTKVIINGQHRFQALRDFGFKKVPVFYVDYLEDLSITFAESSIIREKAQIVSAGLGQELLPLGSALHLIAGDPANFVEPDCYVPLDRLKTRVFTAGVFDLFHIGHVNLLKYAKGLGHYLIVGVQYNVDRYKDARIFYDFEQRIDIIRSLRYVDIAVPYEKVDERLAEIDFDIFARGPDQVHAGFQRALRYCLAHGKQVVTIPRTENISASSLRKGLEEIA
jgi:glycerol-3-phosphate cytidylyltransferase